MQFYLRQGSNAQTVSTPGKLCTELFQFQENMYRYKKRCHQMLACIVKMYCDIISILEWDKV